MSLSFMFIYDLSIFLTIAVFVLTNDIFAFRLFIDKGGKKCTNV